MTDVGMRRAFLVLIAAQAAHSIEEYWFRLYDVLAPTRWLSAAIGSDRATGFLIGNAALLLLAFGCYFASIRPGTPVGARHCLVLGLAGIRQRAQSWRDGAERGRLFPRRRDRAIAAGGRQLAGVAPERARRGLTRVREFQGHGEFSGHST